MKYWLVYFVYTRQDVKNCAICFFKTDTDTLPKDLATKQLEKTHANPEIRSHVKISESAYKEGTKIFNRTKKKIA